MKVVLASRSPRRRELLKWIFDEFETIPSGEPENAADGLSPEELVLFLAQTKAQSVAARCESGALVIGCDTVVVSPGNTVFGIPKDAREAAEMLRALSGNTHRVLTGVCLVKGDARRAFYEETRVKFYPLSDREIQEYLDTGEPFDKAGAYGIQGKGGLLAQSVQGDFYNVVGLPVGRLKREILQFFDDAKKFEKNVVKSL